MVYDPDDFRFNISGFRDTDLSPFLIARAPGSPGNYQVRQHIKKQFLAIGWTVEEETSVQPTPLGSVTFVNVIATLNPSAKRRVILACHYDSKISPLGFVGAMDSAVPCAIMVALAKRLTQRLQVHKSDTTIQMIFFDGEEALVEWTDTDSLYGSRSLAKKWQVTPDQNDPTKNTLANIVVFILLDLIGHPSTHFQRYFVQSDAFYTELVTIEKCLNASGLLSRGSHQMFEDSRRPFNILDDHMPFYQLGVRILHLITYPYPITWHTLFDNSYSLDDNVMNDMMKIFTVFITNLALKTQLNQSITIATFMP
ncbi:unnamed protein product [Lymnaea stagnalis]|uniref:glutaminyl-peptide cyclotransferase n=1 Tax=Lymnaea stagnalis TaxID=6523 RepID=A0AAV2HA10_LYMST